MRHRKKGRKLSRRKGSREALLKNLVRAVIRHEKIKTTEAKAKEVRGLVEKLIQYGKRGDLQSYRQIIAVLSNEALAKKVKDELAVRYKDRQSGFLRIYKIGPRGGDNAPLVILEFV